VSREGRGPEKSTVQPLGSGLDQCYSVSIRDSAITEKAGFIFSGSEDCVTVQSSIASDGEAVVVVCCKKEDGHCKECTATLSITVVDQDGEQLVTKRLKLDCHR